MGLYNTKESNPIQKLKEEKAIKLQLNRDNEKEQIESN